MWDQTFQGSAWHFRLLLRAVVKMPLTFLALVWVHSVLEQGHSHLAVACISTLSSQLFVHIAFCVDLALRCGTDLALRYFTICNIPVL